MTIENIDNKEWHSAPSFAISFSPDFSVENQKPLASGEKVDVRFTNNEVSYRNSGESLGKQSTWTMHNNSQSSLTSDERNELTAQFFFRMHSGQGFFPDNSKRRRLADVNGNPVSYGLNNNTVIFHRTEVQKSIDAALNRVVSEQAQDFQNAVATDKPASVRFL